ncbi:MAG: hypothetical protein AAGI72_06410 [Pseudomonadota bacterium]
MAQKLSEIVAGAQTTVLPGLGHLGVFVNSELVDPVIHRELLGVETQTSHRPG